MIKNLYQKLFNRKDEYRLIYFFNQKIEPCSEGSFERMLKYFTPIENFSEDKKIIILKEELAVKKLYKKREYYLLNSKLKLKNRVSLLKGSRSTIIFFPENEVHQEILDYFKKIYNQEPKVIRKRQNL